MKTFTKILKWTSLSLLLIVAISAIVGGVYGYTQYKKYETMASAYVTKLDRSTFTLHEPTKFYYADGTQLAEIKSNNYKFLKYSEFNKYVEPLFVATEDAKFRTHNGVDYEAYFRAVKVYLKTKEFKQGGSTIPMQLIKLHVLTSEKTLDRKALEYFLAQYLNSKYSKDEIMEFYVNTIFYGNNSTGMATAAKKYFNKEVKDLTLAETATLAAIPNSPTYFDPIKNMKHNKERRNLMIENAYKQGFITASEAKEAESTDVTLNVTKVDNSKEIRKYSYFLKNATKKLMQEDGFVLQTSFNSTEEQETYSQDYDKVYAETEARIKAGGYKIYTSIKKDMQEKLQKSVDDNLSGFKAKSELGIYEIQGSAVTINNQSGFIEAMVPGRSSENEEFNRSFQAFRQPGSSIKPIIVYTPYFDNDGLPSDKVVDEPISEEMLKGRPPVKNSSGGYKGSITVRSAVQGSINTIAYKLLYDLGVDKAFGYLNELNYSKIDKEQDYNVGIALGGFSRGVSLVEMAGAYSTLSHYGLYQEPNAIKQIQFLDKIVYDAPKVFDKETAHRVYRESSAYLMIDVLTDAVLKGTGRGLEIKDMQTYGKTGTTSDSKDGWFCGGTPYYTTVAWVGSDNPREIKGLYGATYPGRIWKQFMSDIHKDLEPKTFEQPSSIIEAWLTRDKETFKTSRFGGRKTLMSMEYYLDHAGNEDEKAASIEEAKLKAATEEAIKVEEIRTNMAILDAAETQEELDNVKLGLIEKLEESGLSEDNINTLALEIEQKYNEASSKMQQ